MTEYISNIYKGRHILFSLVRLDLKNRYRKSFFGVLWSLLSPLGLVVIIGTVFSQIFGQPMKTFIPYLFGGLIPWLYLSACADTGTTSFLNAEGYIKQTQTPIEIFPLRAAFGAFVNLLISLSAFFAIYLIIDVDKFNLSMLFLFPSLLLWIIAGMAISTISGLIHTFIRDYAPVQTLILQGLFYVTPIVFQPDALKVKNASYLYEYNPLYYLLEIVRSPLLGNQIVDKMIWLKSILFICIIFALALIMIKLLRKKIVFKL